MQHHYATHPNYADHPHASRMPVSVRLLIVIAFLGLGFVSGGYYGMLAVGLGLAVLGCCFPYRPKVNIEQNESSWEQIDTARRGSEIDPTRPDDHPLLLTHEIVRRR